MTRLMNSFLRSAMLLIAIFLFFCAGAFAQARISIPASPCGPMEALQEAGKSVKLLPFLQHEDGSPVLPTEYRTLADKVFYLPANAQPDVAKTLSAINAEVSNFGPSKGCGTGAAASNCSDTKKKLEEAEAKIAELNSTIDDQKEQLGKAKDSVGQATAKATQATEMTDEAIRQRNIANQEAKELRAMADSLFSWWWLLLIGLLTLLIGFVVGLALAVFKFSEQVRKMKNSLASYEEKWNDIDAVRNRLAELDPATDNR